MNESYGNIRKTKSNGRTRSRAIFVMLGYIAQEQPDPQMIMMNKEKNNDDNDEDED